MELPITAKQIKNSKDYVDIDGSIYTYVSNYKGQKTSRLIKKAQHINVSCGYVYCGVYDNETKKCRKRRVNRVVAEAFIPNPNHYPIVGHINNIKTDNRVENLYWTTSKVNTKKAVDDGLMAQSKGIEDSQSKPVNMYETKSNTLLNCFGSCREAAKVTGIPITTITRHAKTHCPVRKEYYFRYVDDCEEFSNVNVLVGKYDYMTDELLETYYNTGDAARKNNLSGRTVCQHIAKGKPKHNFLGFYFNKLPL